jgi:hypothetical protein
MKGRKLLAMKLLPKRSVYCVLRVATTACVSGDIIPSPESAAHWVWTWPRLLGWKRSITWLFLPVFDSLGRAHWSLWGIDSAGWLIIVELESSRGQFLKDPFKNFVSHVRTRYDSRALTTRELRAMWHAYLKTHRTVQHKRLTAAYKQAVEHAFALRQAAGNPPPVFVALVAAGGTEVCFSEDGVKNLLLLQELVGSSRVLLRSISGSLRPKRLRIECWSPRLRLKR